VCGTFYRTEIETEKVMPQTKLPFHWNSLW